MKLFAFMEIRFQQVAENVVPQLIPNTVSYFKTLPEDIKEYYRTLYTQWTWDESKTFENRSY